MTKQNARKILAAQTRINGILEGLRNTLTGDELVYFENYWGAAIRGAVNDGRYGSAPIIRAEETLET